MHGEGKSGTAQGARQRGDDRRVGAEVGVQVPDTPLVQVFTQHTGLGQIGRVIDEPSIRFPGVRHRLLGRRDHTARAGQGRPQGR